LKEKTERVLSAYEGSVRAETGLLGYASDTSTGGIILVANGSPTFQLLVVTWGGLLAWDLKRESEPAICDNLERIAHQRDRDRLCGDSLLASKLMH